MITLYVEEKELTEVKKYNLIDSLEVAQSLQSKFMGIVSELEHSILLV